MEKYIIIPDDTASLDLFKYIWSYIHKTVKLRQICLLWKYIAWNISHESESLIISLCPSCCKLDAVVNKDQMLSSDWCLLAFTPVTLYANEEDWRDMNYVV